MLPRPLLVLLWLLAATNAEEDAIEGEEESDNLDLEEQNVEKREADIPEPGGEGFTLPSLAPLVDEQNSLLKQLEEQEKREDELKDRSGHHRHHHRKHHHGRHHGGRKHSSMLNDREGASDEDGGGGDGDDDATTTESTTTTTSTTLNPLRFHPNHYLMDRSRKIRDRMIGGAGNMPNENCTEPATEPKQCGSDKPMISAFVWQNQSLTCKEILYRGCEKTRNYFVNKKACLSACYIPPMAGLNAQFYPPGSHGEWDPPEGTGPGGTHGPVGVGDGGPMDGGEGGDMGPAEPENDINEFFSDQKVGTDWCLDEPLNTYFLNCDAISFHRYFVFKLNRCVPLIYGMCANSELEKRRRKSSRNIFTSRQDCVKVCGVTLDGAAPLGKNDQTDEEHIRESIHHVQELESPGDESKTKDKHPCTMAPKIMGECHNFTRMWSFMMENGLCEDFVWGGCETGTKNKFWSPNACEECCKKMDDPTVEGGNNKCGTEKGGANEGPGLQNRVDQSTVATILEHKREKGPADAVAGDGPPGQFPAMDDRMAPDLPDPDAVDPEDDDERDVEEAVGSHDDAAAMSADAMPVVMEKKEGKKAGRPDKKAAKKRIRQKVQVSMVGGENVL